jgi:hypothetical protein
MPGHLLRDERDRAGRRCELSDLSSSPNGPLVVCAETVANPGAKVASKCFGASMTPLVPFTLVTGNTLTLKRTGANCTGAATIKLTPICTRLTSYAIAS